MNNRAGGAVLTFRSVMANRLALAVKNEGTPAHMILIGSGRVLVGFLSTVIMGQPPRPCHFSFKGKLSWSLDNLLLCARLWAIIFFTLELLSLRRQCQNGVIRPMCHRTGTSLLPLQGRTVKLPPLSVSFDHPLLLYEQTDTIDRL